MLHIISKILQNNVLQHCINLIKLQSNANLLLYQDGVYLAITEGIYSNQLQQLFNNNTIYVLEEDVRARGIIDQLLKNIILINYQQFVELTIKNNKTISW